MAYKPTKAQQEVIAQMATGKALIYSKFTGGVWLVGKFTRRVKRTVFDAMVRHSVIQAGKQNGHDVFYVLAHTPPAPAQEVGT